MPTAHKLHGGQKLLEWHKLHGGQKLLEWQKRRELLQGLLVSLPLRVMAAAN
jgi:hypothetical protein